MSNPNIKPMVAALCAVLLAGPALAQGNPQTSQPNQNPAASPVQGAQTGMSRSPDTTSPSTRDPVRSSGQVTDGRSPGPVPGPTGPAGDRREGAGSTIGSPMGVPPDSNTGTGIGRPSATSGTQSSAITNQPPGGPGTNITNESPGGPGTNVTNAPVGSRMDSSQGGRAAAANDADRRDGSANVAPTAGQRAGDVPGANSFTESQARSRMEGAGFSQVSDLRRDDNGVWRGTATRDGRRVQVSVDYQGNVTHR
ncbi:PepSY domain-containing protein [Sabulicella rubraurantiaca]|uniref:PepSY domain-containing protein n=1 Tax=Sabulicella rubraurantiaca TaxID=2811429 RepID=UPI001A97961D|nr:PepSY domain-containing protein [Sabulicella rubraurantiaca]